MDRSHIISENIIQKHQGSIVDFSNDWSGDFEELNGFFESFNIISSTDENIVKPYSKDWSNMNGSANLLVRPLNKIECAIILKTCHNSNIPLTISAGKTNLTGSATPNGGVVLSTSLLITPDIELDLNNKLALSPVGIPLETFRNKILEMSNKTLCYTADPTSRNDAFVGGTISTNASGFVPGEKGAMRYWVREIEFLLPNGDLVNIEKGQYISQEGIFHIEYDGNDIQLPIPTYDRPKIKNASGLYSDKSGIVDLIDLIVGSEGILGMVTACRLKLSENPKDKLELFISFNSESKAIDFYDYLNEDFDKGLGQLTALEYFGYNSQQYMDHKEFLFKNKDDVGIYLQIPIFNDSIDSKMEQWTKLFHAFDPNLDLDNVVVLNDPNNWKKFFEARHSIPDNALTKTQQIGGVSIITDTIVPPHNFRIYLDKVHSSLKKAKIEYLLFGHLGDCHLHFHLIPDSEQERECLEIYDYLIDLSSKLGGVYSAEHGTGKRKRNDFKKCYGQEAVEMVKQLKLAIDPNNYLNRGNLVG